VEADIFYRMTSSLVGVVQPVALRNIQLQQQAELQNYLQFPRREVDIRVVNSIESLQYAADVLGVSLNSWSADSTTTSESTPMLELPSKESPYSEEAQKNVGAEYLQAFLCRRFPPTQQDVWPSSKSTCDLSQLLGYRNIVGLDSEWKVVMYSTNQDRFGCSILQVCRPSSECVYLELKISREIRYPARPMSSFWISMLCQSRRGIRRLG
jgi:hypothetical protein